MGKPAFTKIAVAVLVLVAFLIYRQHKNVQNAAIIAQHTPELLSPAVISGSCTLVEYRGSGTALWSDRTYHSDEPMSLVMGFNFLRTPRNHTAPYVLNVLETTFLYTLANAQDTLGTTGWVRVEEVLVDDVIKERRLNRLLSKAVPAGKYIVRPRVGGPAQPVFFSGSKVQLEGLNP